MRHLSPVKQVTRIKQRYCRMLRWRWIASLLLGLSLSLDAMACIARLKYPDNCSITEYSLIFTATVESYELGKRFADLSPGYTVSLSHPTVLFGDLPAPESLTFNGGCGQPTPRKGYKSVFYIMRDSGEPLVPQYYPPDSSSLERVICDVKVKAEDPENAGENNLFCKTKLSANM